MTQHNTQRRARTQAVRACITWLHDRAATMNDPHARNILNSAAFDLAHTVLDIQEAAALSSPLGGLGSETKGDGG